MSETVFKLGVVKLGCIGAAPLLDFILDERADREDLDTRAYTSGAKLDPGACEGPTKDAIAYQPDLVLLVSPNAALPGPTNSRLTLAEANIPTISLGDGPSKKAFFKKNDEGKQVVNTLDRQGFIVIPCDPMIGARREFLDPTEMALFNADVIRLLSATGVFRMLQGALDTVIGAMKAGQTPALPMVEITAEKAIEAAGFGNPYAAAKAYAALKIAESVAGVTTKGCFQEQDPARYIAMVAAGHEMMRAAARLADEAREMEKSEDSILRTPHAVKGEPRKKIRLAEKPA